MNSHLPLPLQREVSSLIARAVPVDKGIQKFEREELLGYVYGIAAASVGRCRDDNILVLRDLYGQLIVFEAFHDGRCGTSVVYIYFNFPGTEQCDGEDGGPKRLAFNSSSLQDLKDRIKQVPIVPAETLALGLR